MDKFAKAVSYILNFPMGSSARYFNGLIQGGAVVAVLWLLGVIAF